MKQNMLDSALRFFLEKGYLATSIQNIADDCGVAKGSFYKFFQSKEDLFIEVNLQQQQIMYERIKNVRMDQTLSLREVFIQETQCQIEFFMDNHFIMQDIKELSAPNGKIGSCIFSLRANLLKYNKESLTRTFGEDVKPNIWDLVMIYNGIVREFVFLIIFEKKALSIRDIAQFIVHCMEDMATNMKAKARPSLLQDSDMSEYVQYVLSGGKIPDHKHILDLIEHLMSTIKELHITNSEKTELHEATVLLREELESEQPKSVLIRALIAFLEKENGLKDILISLEKLVMKQLMKEL